MIKTWDTTELGDMVIMRTGAGDLVQGHITNVIALGTDAHYEICIRWSISEIYKPEYAYPRHSVFGNFEYASRMFFYTEPHEELVGKLKLSKD